jgi:hypothetical protein
MRSLVGAGAVIFVVLFLAAPHTVFGQTVTRYGSGPCPENVIPRGIYRYPVGVDEKTITLRVDPAFETMMRKERRVPVSLPVTPIYDLVVEAAPVFGSCYTEEPNKFSTELPRELPLLGYISVKGEKISPDWAFARNAGRVLDDGRPLYEWKFKGWPDGIAPQKTIEKLIAAARANDPSLTFVVELKNFEGGIERVEKGVTFGLCAPLSGSGEHKIVYMRGAREGTLASFIRNDENVRQNGFEAIDPYKKYRVAFSHYADLVRHVGMAEWAEEFNREEKRVGVAMFKAFINNKARLLRKFASNSACAGGIKLMYEPGGLPPTVLGQTRVFSDAAFISVRPQEEITVHSGGVPDPAGTGTLIGGTYTTVKVDSEQAALVSVHEHAHAFAGLADEYLYYNGPEVSDRDVGPLRGPNCSTDPSHEWRRGEVKYGDFHHQGCSYSYMTGGAWDSRLPLYRPSATSIMNTGSSDKFNVVSCGYIIAAIRGGDGPDYWDECMRLDTIKPTMKTEELESKGLVGLNMPMPTQPVMYTRSVPNNLLTVEEFLPDGTIRGNAYEVSGDVREVIDSLRARVQELTARRDELRGRLNALRGVWETPVKPLPVLPPSPILNVAPLRQQLGDISEALRGVLEWLGRAVR